MCGLFLTVWAYRFSIYAAVSHYDRERLKYLRYQESIGAYPAYIPRLPYEEYVIVSYPYEDLWQDRFKKFYGLNLDVKYELISFEDWKERTSRGSS